MQNSGKRRLAFVRRFRLNKRPQDVLETAESQNLGRITDNALQSTDTRIFSKNEEKEDFKPSRLTTVGSSIIGSSSMRGNNEGGSILNEYITPTEVVTEKEDEAATSPVAVNSVTAASPLSNEAEEYAMQNDFAQMLSDFLNSNDQSTKTVNNFERNGISTENSISYILSLSNSDNAANIISNSSSADASHSHPVTSEATYIDNVITITNSPLTSTEFTEHSTTPEVAADTYVPDKSLSTSTTTEISLETEICYRGKCVKTKKSKASDLLPVE